jgi:hypothetical protein
LILVPPAGFGTRENVFVHVAADGLYDVIAHGVAKSRIQAPAEAVLMSPVRASAARASVGFMLEVISPSRLGLADGCRNILFVIFTITNTG